MNNNWIPVTDRPLRFIDDGHWFLTLDGEKEFLAAVPYIDNRQPDKELWWIRHCVVENGSLCVVGDDENMPAGYELVDVTHWQPIPEPPSI